MGRSPSARVSPSGTPVAEGADTRGSLAIVATALPVALPQRRRGARACGWGGVHSRENQATGRVVAVHADLMAFLQAHRRERVATLDQDATLVASHKEQALFCYKGFRAYRPLNTWWAEQQVVVHSEFRDGNVPAGFQQLRVLKEALELLPEGVEEVRPRSDTAGYQWELLRYCEEGRNPRFGRIEFAVGADVTPAFKQAATRMPELTWRPLPDSDQEWAEVCFVSQRMSQTLKGNCRFIAVREPIRLAHQRPGQNRAPRPSPVGPPDTGAPLHRVAPGGPRATRDLGDQTTAIATDRANQPTRLAVPGVGVHPRRPRGTKYDATGVLNPREAVVPSLSA